MQVMNTHCSPPGDHRSRAMLLLCVVLCCVCPAGRAMAPALVPGLPDLVPPVSSVLQLPPTHFLTEGDQFEYIVVGAGAAGCAVAARLALAGARVLLVEAGGDPDLLSTIPAAAMGLLGSPLDWQYETIPNGVSCLGSEGRQCRFSRGKCLGGSTSINYMLYVRGARRDYELGVPGWSWASLEPYFLRYEALQDLALLPAASALYHNTSGIMPVGLFADSGNPWHARIREGLEELGFPFNADVNAESQIGVTRSVGYVFEGERMTSARAYLTRPDVKRRLKVAKWTRCTGVILDEGNVARGVRVRTLVGPTVRVYATREVVLSAGAVGTPQLLQLSGVGPARHLRALGVPLRADLPVGEHMSDHVLPLVFIRVDRSLLGEGADLAGLIAQAAEYGLTRAGPFASDGLTDMLAFANIKCYDTERRQLLNNRSECESPTLQLISAYIDRGLIPVGQLIVKHATNLNDNIIKQLSDVNAHAAIIIASPVVLRPHSRGWVRLASADPLSPPAVFPNYLSDARDVGEAVRAIALLEQLVQTAAYARHNASLVRLSLAGCPRPAAAGYWPCYARHLTFSVYHAAGTAALGRVLDARLRVRAVRRLRVADLSALPEVPAGNTAAAAIAIGERAADLIIEDK